MTQRRGWLLALAAGLFAAWIGYLAYLALMNAGHAPIVLSRPQFLVADVWVIAEVKDLDQPIKIDEVVYPAEAKEPKKETEINPSNLADCKEHWQGPGRYIIPLSRPESGGYHVTPVPHGPPALPPRIYPDNDETRAQLNQLPRP